MEKSQIFSSYLCEVCENIVKDQWETDITKVTQVLLTNIITTTQQWMFGTIGIYFRLNRTRDSDKIHQPSNILKRALGSTHSNKCGLCRKENHIVFFTGKWALSTGLYLFNFKV